MDDKEKAERIAKRKNLESKVDSYAKSVADEMKKHGVKPVSWSPHAKTKGIKKFSDFLK